MSLVLPGGVYPPLPTFFGADGKVDIATLRRHISWLLQIPLAGVLVLGSNGEAAHLDDSERRWVVAGARMAIDAANTRDHASILLAGAGDQSTRGTIARCQVVAEVGAEAAVILPPFAFPTQMTPAALRAHFLAVAEASPIPIVIYNMPANTANLDLSADLILEIAAHPNVIGVKDSSGQVAKLARIASEAKPGFAVLAGSGSFFLPSLAVGGTGTIAAVANVIPALVQRLYTTWTQREQAATVAAMRASEVDALALQAAIIPLNQAVTAGWGVAGLKAALEIAQGYGGAPRAPLLPLADGQRAELRQIYQTTIRSR